METIGKSGTVAVSACVLSIAPRANASGLHTHWPTPRLTCTNRDAWALVTSRKPNANSFKHYFKHACLTQHHALWVDYLHSKPLGRTWPLGIKVVIQGTDTATVRHEIIRRQGIANFRLKFIPAWNYSNAC